MAWAPGSEEAMPSEELSAVETGTAPDAVHPTVHEEASPAEIADAPQARGGRQADDSSDSEGFGDSTQPTVLDRGQIDWATETNPQRIASELRRIEAELRRLLESRDPKRKRKMAGTRRWQELEEDIISWKFSNRIDEDVLRQLSDLIAKRHHLYARLRFLAFTRPTWNS